MERRGEERRGEERRGERRGEERRIKDKTGALSCEEIQVVTRPSL